MLWVRYYYGGTFNAIKFFLFWRSLLIFFFVEHFSASFKFGHRAYGCNRWIPEARNFYGLRQRGVYYLNCLFTA